MPDKRQTSLFEAMRSDLTLTPADLTPAEGRRDVQGRTADCLGRFLDNFRGLVHK